MAQAFKVDVDEAQLKKVEKLLKGVKDGYSTVVSQGTNKALSGVKTAASKEIRKDVTIKAKRVNDSIKIKKATKQDLRAAIRCKTGFTPLSFFSVTQRKTGVSIQVSKGGSRKIWPGTFIATVGKYRHEGRGHTGIFTRIWRKHHIPTEMSNKAAFLKFKNPDKWRLHIQEQFGPRISGIFGKDPVMNPVLKKAGTIIKKEIDAKLKHELGKLR